MTTDLAERDREGAQVSSLNQSAADDWYDADGTLEIIQRRKEGGITVAMVGFFCSWQEQRASLRGLLHGERYSCHASRDLWVRKAPPIIVEAI